MAKQREAFNGTLVTDHGRSAYMRSLAQKRLEVLGQDHPAALEMQAILMKKVGVDPRAGFDGKPPAFEGKTVMIGKVKVHAGVWNVNRDPMRRMFRRGELTELEYKAAAMFADKCEEFASQGLRGASFKEAVDGGRQPNVSLIMLHVAGAHTALVRALSSDQFAILTLIVVDGVTLARVAANGAFGFHRPTLSKKFRAALQILVGVFGLRRLMPAESITSADFND